MKKKLKGGVLFFFLLVVISFFSDKILAANLKLNDLKFEITVNEDASMNVTEIWDIKIRDTNTIFKTFKKDIDKYTSITDVIVTNMETNTKLKEIDEYMYHVNNNSYYGLDINNNEFEIAWGVGLENSSDTRQYKIEYKVEDAIALHGDCAELYWQLIGSDFEIPIENIEGNITLPGNISKNDIRVWGHTETLNGIINATDDGNIEFKLENIPEKNMVEIRATFPKDVITSSGRTDDMPKIDSIIREETSWANSANERREEKQNYERKVIIGSLIGACIIFAIEIRYMIKAIRHAKENKLVPTLDVDYYRDLPREDATPAQAYSLLDRNLYKNYIDLENVFPATLMDLNIKKYLIFEVLKDEKNKEEIIIRLTDNTNIDVLSEDEKVIYEFIKEAIDSTAGKQINIKKLQNYIERHTSKIFSLGEKIFKIVMEFFKNNNYIKEQEYKMAKNINNMTLFTFLSMVYYPVIMLVWKLCRLY